MCPNRMIRNDSTINQNACKWFPRQNEEEEEGQHSFNARAELLNSLHKRTSNFWCYSNQMKGRDGPTQTERGEWIPEVMSVPASSVGSRVL